VISNNLTHNLFDHGVIPYSRLPLLIMNASSEVKRLSLINGSFMLYLFRRDTIDK
jgi:hypothetical protein